MIVGVRHALAQVRDMLVRVRDMLGSLQFMLATCLIAARWTTLDSRFTRKHAGSRQHDTMVIQASTIDTWQTRYNNAMHTEHSFVRARSGWISVRAR